MSPHNEGNGEAQSVSPPSGFLDRLAWLGGLVSAALILAILGLTAVAVTMRYGFNDPLLITDEAVGFLVVATVMFGAAEALRRGDHINIDILTDKAPPRLRRWLDIFAYLAVLGFSIVLLLSAWHTVSFSLDFEAYSTGALEMPLWIPQSTMLVGASLLGLVAFAKVVALLRGGAAR